MKRLGIHMHGWVRPSRAAVITAVGLWLALFRWNTDSHAATYTWAPTGSGSYNWTDNQWGGGYPNAIGDLAIFTTDITGNQTINLNTNITLGSLIIGDSATTYCPFTIAAGSPAGSLTFDVASGSAMISNTLSPLAVRNTIGADIHLNDPLLIAGTNLTELMLSGNISGAQGIVIGQPPSVGTNGVYLLGSNTYSGATVISNSSSVYINSIANADGTPSALGAPATAQNGAIKLFSGNSSTPSLRYFGTGHSTDRILWFHTTSAASRPVLQASGTGRLIFTAPAVSNTSSQADILYLTGSGEGEIQGTIGNGAVAGLKLYKLGSGTWALKGSNTFSGGVEIGDSSTTNGGTLQIWNDNALGTGQLTLRNADTLEILGGDRVITNTIEDSLNGVTGLTIKGSNNLTVASWGKSYPNNSRIHNNLDSGKTLTVNGTFLTAQNSNTRTIAGTGDTMLEGPVTGGTALVAMEGAGTLTIKGTCYYTGATIVRRGTMALDLSTSSITNTSAALTLGGGTFKIKGAAAGTSAQTLGGTFTLEPFKDSRIVIDDSGAAGTTLTLGNTWSYSSGSSGLLNIDISSNNAVLTSTPSVSRNLVQIGTYAARVTVKDSTGNIGFASTNGAGNIERYTGASTFTAATDNGTGYATNYVTKATDAAYSGSPATITMSSAAHRIHTLHIDTSAGSGVINLNGTNLDINISNGGAGSSLLVTGSGDFTITNGIIQRNGTTLLIQHYGTGTLRCDAPPVSAGGTFIKGGPGTVVLTRLANNAGDTHVANGILNLRHGIALGPGSVAVRSGATLELQSGSMTMANSFGDLAGTGVTNSGALRNVAGANICSGSITVGTYSATIKNDDIANSLTLSGIIETGSSKDLTLGGPGNITIGPNKITGAGNVTMDGTGTLTLSGTNDYTGLTTVNSGTLKMSGVIAGNTTVNTNATLTGSGTCSGTVRVNAGGTLKTLEDSSANTMTVGNLILDSGSITRIELVNNTSDMISVTNSGAATDTQGLTIHPGAKLYLAGNHTSGTYPLLQFNGAVKGSVTNLTIINSTSASIYALSTTASNVTLRLVHRNGAIYSFN